MNTWSFNDTDMVHIRVLMVVQMFTTKRNVGKECTLLCEFPGLQATDEIVQLEACRGTAELCT